MSAQLTVRTYRGTVEFLAAAGPWLMRHEDRNGQILAVAHLLKTADHPFRDPIYFATVHDGDTIAGAALAATPDGLELSDFPPGIATALVASVATVRPDLWMVSGPAGPTLEFARAWAQQRGGAWQLRHNWQLFRLETVVAPRPVAGRLRAADDGDWAWLERWAPGYAEQTNTAFDVAGYFQRRLRRRELYIWDHDGPKTAVAVAGHTPNGARISAVYTPEHRGRGYASNAVAGVSQRVLDGGAAFLTLVSEREPAQAARIYRAVGFEPVREQVVVDLAG
jgi:GNAT superfamily N-acetyltransferase